MNDFSYMTFSEKELHFPGWLASVSAEIQGLRVCVLNRFAAELAAFFTTGPVAEFVAGLDDSTKDKAFHLTPPHHPINPSIPQCLHSIRLSNLALLHSPAIPSAGGSHSARHCGKGQAGSDGPGAGAERRGSGGAG